VAFALTERGHRFDTERASLKKEHLLDEARLHQNYNAIGYNDPETNQNPAKLINVFRFGPNGDHPTVEARHQAYVAAQHAQGRNAYNPFGGLLTPLPEERGATTGFLAQVPRRRRSITQPRWGSAWRRVITSARSRRTSPLSSAATSPKRPLP
jgi:hypothetical protein